MVELQTKGRRQKLCILFGCGIAAALVLTLWLQREPRCDGRTLSEWVWQLETPNYPPNHRASEAISEIGTNALPFLIKWIQYEQKPWRNHLGTLCSKLPRFGDRLSLFVEGHGYERQQGAFSALYILGPRARPAMPILVDLTTTQPQNIGQSLAVLARIGGDGLTPVLYILTNPASPFRFAAINAIHDADLTVRRPLDPIVVSALTNCLADPDRELAFCAAQILCWHDSHKELAMKTLVGALAIDDKKLQRNAIMRLRLSLKRGYSVPAMLQFLQDTNSPVSPYAAGALTDLLDDDVKLPETVLPALTNALHDPRPKVRSYAADAVGRFKAAAEPAAPALLDLWNDPDEWVRRSATNALFELPSYRGLQNQGSRPTGMSFEQAQIFERRYGLHVSTRTLPELLTNADIRIREIGTNVLRTLQGSNVVNQTHENASR